MVPVEAVRLHPFRKHSYLGGWVLLRPCYTAKYAKVIYFPRNVGRDSSPGPRSLGDSRLDLGVHTPQLGKCYVNRCLSCSK
jgi:hypothetical protein